MTFAKIIGLDIGHGETSAVCMDVEKKKISILALSENQDRVIPSVVGIKADGSVVLGSAAGQGNDVAQVMAYFKQPPKDFDKPAMGRTYGQWMSLFVKELFRQIFENNKDLLTRNEADSIQLVAGCPSTTDWTGEENRAAYEALLREASGFAHTYVVPESRAALFSAFTDKGVSDISVTDGVLVFDFGSSTADCTYMNMGKMRMEYSWTLGASKIEELMFDELQKNMEKEAGDKGVAASYSRIRGIEFDLRVDYKEKYYANKLPNLAVYVRYANVVNEAGEPVTDGSGAPKMLQSSLMVDKSLMEKVTGQAEFFISQGGDGPNQKGSWASHCAGFFKKAKKELKDRGLPCKAVILTGGASKMGFVRDLCTEIYGDPGDGISVLFSNDQSFCVSRGLAWTGMVDSQIEEASHRAKEAAKKKASCSIHTMAAIVSGKATPILSAIISRSLLDWANKENDLSIKDLQDEIASHCEDAATAKELEEAFRDGISAWVDQCMGDVQELAAREVSEIYGQEMSMSLGLTKKYAEQAGMGVGGLVLPNIDVGKTVLTTFCDVGTLTALIVTLFVMGNPFLGLLLSGLFEIVNKLFGRDENTKLNSKKRLKYVKKEDRILKNFDNKFREELAKQFREEREQIVNGMIDEMIDILALRKFEQEIFLER